MNETILTSSNINMKRKRSIYYYQWLPILLAIQSLGFLIPRIIWSSFSSRCGINIQHVLSPTYDYRTCRYKVRHITTMLIMLAKAKYYDFNRSNQQPKTSFNHIIKSFNIFCLPFFFLNENIFHGYYLTNLFLIVKLLFLLNSTLQLFLLNTLLTKNALFYGVEVIDNFLRGEYVVGSKIFPLTVYCDFSISKVGHPTLYTVSI
ncbi:unnamed protein product [Didymodactylos carnosus]|uniref:Innexin n=1 Tax=Didymodactylos carnosus TaxID=1234261 RepID=A0A8S2I9X9_9BILA|nr:unnamed protein product [Didymodactylos carnosus]CAF3734705.1 unnamed protein product [Didymodactylos carnosus]